MDPRIETLDRLQRVVAFALDLDGTTYLGEHLLPGAREFKSHCDARGLPVVFVTNNSSHSHDEYVTRLNRLGLPVRSSEVLTSAEATIAFLRSERPDARVFLLGTPAVQHEFQVGGVELVADPDCADTVVLAYDTTLTYEKLRILCDLVRRGCFFVATHPDVNCPMPGSQRSSSPRTQDFWPDVGAFLALVQASTDRLPDEVIGKPSRRMVEAIARRLHAAPEQIAFVGDRLYTDVAMARESGMVAVLVLSGETRAQDLADSRHQPDLVVRDLKELAEMVGRVQRGPG